MDINQKKEQFSVAYVNAIAAQAGLSNAKPSVDDDSIDLSLKGRGFCGKIRSSQLDLQLKCTSRDLVKDGFIRFPLPIKNYNDLRGEDILIPRYLAVLLVPELDSEWAELRDEELVLRNTCHWVSIRNLPEKNNLSTVTVEIPLAQRLTKDTLLMLMQFASEGEYL